MHNIVEIIIKDTEKAQEKDLEKKLSSVGSIQRKAEDKTILYQVNILIQYITMIYLIAQSS